VVSLGEKVDVWEAGAVAAEGDFGRELHVLKGEDGRGDAARNVEHDRTRELERVLGVASKPKLDAGAPFARDDLLGDAVRRRLQYSFSLKRWPARDGDAVRVAVVLLDCKDEGVAVADRVRKGRKGPQDLGALESSARRIGVPDRVRRVVARPLGGLALVEFRNAACLADAEERLGQDVLVVRRVEA
jgi:hypothetical protein